MFGEIYTPFIFTLYQKFIFFLSRGKAQKTLESKYFLFKMKFTADFMADTLTDRLGGLEIMGCLGLDSMAKLLISLLFGGEEDWFCIHPLFAGWWECTLTNQRRGCADIRAGPS